MSVFPVPGGPYRRIPRGGYNSQDKIKGQASVKYLCDLVLSANFLEILCFKKATIGHKAGYSVFVLVLQ